MLSKAELEILGKIVTDSLDWFDSPSKWAKGELAYETVVDAFEGDAVQIAVHEAELLEMANTGQVPDCMCLEGALCYFGRRNGIERPYQNTVFCEVKVRSRLTSLHMYNDSPSVTFEDIVHILEYVKDSIVKETNDAN